MDKKDFICEGLEFNEMNKSCIDKFPQASVYCPSGTFRDIYDNDVALARGTIFSALDKPFLGRRAISE